MLTAESFPKTLGGFDPFIFDHSPWDVASQATRIPTFYMRPDSFSSEIRVPPTLLPKRKFSWVNYLFSVG